MQFLTGPHPDALGDWGYSTYPIQLTADIQYQTCPECGHRSDVDGWDCMGADDGNVFCPRCTAEVPSVPEIIEEPVSDKAAKILAAMEAEEEPQQLELFGDDA